MKTLVYADNAATTKLDPFALEAMMPFLSESYGNASQPYGFGLVARSAVKNARNTIAECINAEPSEIYFTSGGTESDNWAIKAAGLRHSKRIITSLIEHHAVLNSCLDINRFGALVSYIEASSSGIITPDSLDRFLDCDTDLVSVMLANNELGTIQPIKELCALSHEHGALFHTDAVQAVGHIPIDVRSLDIDLLSASAHKFNGPKGIGFLYIKKGIQLSPYLSGGAQENHLRAGTENVAGIVGMAVALNNNIAEIGNNTEHVHHLEQRLLEEIKARGIQCHRNGCNDGLPGVISLSFPGKDGEAILHRLDLMGICVSTGAACDSKNTQISHVLKAIGLPEELAKGTIRISLGKYNTEDDVLKIVEGLNKIVNGNI